MNTQTQYPKPEFVIADSITIYFHDESRPKVIARSHPNFRLALDAIRNEQWGTLKELTDMVSTIARYSKGAFEVRGDNLFYKDQIIEGALADKVITMMKQRLPFDSLLKFYENLQENPSMVARRELYDFLNAQDEAPLPITEDGHFLAYKAVRNDWTDKHSGKILNRIGDTVTMPRPNVNDDRTMGCSYGLHAGSWSYVQSFGSTGDRFIMVKINPRDVVSVPSEDFRKLRCCEYTVVRTFDTQLLDPVYAADGGAYEVPENQTFEVMSDDEVMEVFDNDRYETSPNFGNVDIKGNHWNDDDDDDDYNDDEYDGW